jgi:hypothetical protein
MAQTSTAAEQAAAMPSRASYNLCVCAGCNIQQTAHFMHYPAYGFEVLS